MAAHRYWRAVSLEAYGTGDLELSCFHLLDAAGARVDAPATLTSNAAPTTGTLSNLQDDDLTTAARWSVQSVATLSLQWDFGGAPADVTDIRLAGDSEVRFPLIVKLQWSDDATAWTDLATYAGIAWPGAGVKTASVSGIIVKNKVEGRSAAYTPLTVGTGPAIVYGIPQIAPPVYLGVETGFKDYISGVLGQGIGRVRGTVKVVGTPHIPVYRKVRLIREKDGLVLREQWSNPITGAYDFQYVDELQVFTVVSYDHTKDKRAVIADNLTLANTGVGLISGG